MGRHWLGNTKQNKQAFRLTQRYGILIFCWLINCLMPSDKRNLKTASATGLILFSVQHHFSPRHAFCHTAVHAMHYSWTNQCPLCFPFIFTHRKKCQFCGRHMMVSIHNRNLIMASLIVEVLFKQLLISITVEHSWQWSIMATLLYRW